MPSGRQNELTHLPEYAILNILTIQAIKGGEAKRRKKADVTHFYSRSAAITCVFGVIDELYQGILPLRYFSLHDIFLNALGGVLGPTIFWGLTRE